MIKIIKYPKPKNIIDLPPQMPRTRDPLSYYPGEDHLDPLHIFFISEEEPLLVDIEKIGRFEKAVAENPCHPTSKKWEIFMNEFPENMPAYRTEPPVLIWFIQFHMKYQAKIGKKEDDPS